MAGLTILDTSVLIAALDQNDKWAEDAATIIQGADRLAAGTLTFAEALVKPTLDGRGDTAYDRLADLDIEEATLPTASAERLAALRASTGLKMPDAYVLHLAVEHGAVALASRDERLRVAASRLSLATP